MLQGEEFFGICWFYFSPELLINPERRRIWLQQRMKLLRRSRNLKQLLHLTSRGQSHCLRDLECSLFRYFYVDDLSGFGKDLRLFNRDQITKIDV